MLRRPLSNWLRTSRSPHGERGLKYRADTENCAWCRRSPHGERGLKSRADGRRFQGGYVALLMESVD